MSSAPGVPELAVESVYSSGRGVHASSALLVSSLCSVEALGKKV